LRIQKKISTIETPERRFALGHVLTITGGHFVHDTYSAFVPPLLPLVIEKLSLSLTLAGVLTAVLQLPAILNPLIGYLADKVDLRFFVIFAPATTATLIGALGLAPNYFSLIALFFLIGISVAFFHAPSPAMIAQVSGRRVGFGMGLYMAAGELGRTVGPIVAVSAVAAWGLDGIYRLIVIGWASSFLLLWRFRGVSSSHSQQKSSDLRSDLPKLRSFFLPLLFILLPRAFLTSSITTYLPTFLRSEGASLALAGISLSVLEGAGVLGALFSGTLSDRFGRKSTLLVLITLSALLMFAFLGTTSWIFLPVLLLLGFVSLAPQPVFLALVQDHLPNNRAAANGLYMSMSFLIRSLVLILLGVSGDVWGLRPTFYVSAIISLAAIPAILFLPNDPNSDLNNPSSPENAHLEDDA
jgi:FSR family fosmidomycin resistance protein-like MFS transporter